jgi:hypothetical protein
MSVSAADATMFQELKRTTKLSCIEAELKARQCGWSLTVAPGVTTAAGGRSAGVGIAARTTYGLGRPKVAPVDAQHSSRAHCAWFPGLLKGGVHLITVYLWTGEKPTSARNRALLEIVARMIDALDGPWILGGDMQCSPAEFNASNWPRMVGGQVVAPAMPTCGSATIDFFVVSNGLRACVHSIRVLEDAGTAPHRGTRLTVWGNARSRMVRKMTTPRPIASLPAGPCNTSRWSLWIPEEVTRDNLDSCYSQWIAEVEVQAMAFLAPSPETEVSLCGRTEAPATVWRNALGPPGANAFK